MRNLKIIIGTLTVLLIVLLTAVSSKKEPDSLSYLASNEITTTGTVEEVQEFFCPVTEDRGTHVMLKTDTGRMLVHVSIARFMREHQLAIQKGDRLQVRGAKIHFHGKEGLIAREIVRGDEVFTFRDSAGKPLWSN
jgi:hypothetical protein